jgi:hypothetical protein
VRLADGQQTVLGHSFAVLSLKIGESIMTARTVAFLFVALFAASTATEIVAAERGSAEEQKACARDTRRLCRGVQNDDESMLSCLQSHRNRLSSGCREVLRSHGR